MVKTRGQTEIHESHDQQRDCHKDGERGAPRAVRGALGQRSWTGFLLQSLCEMQHCPSSHCELNPAVSWIATGLSANWLRISYRHLGLGKREHETWRQCDSASESGVRKRQDSRRGEEGYARTRTFPAGTVTSEQEQEKGATV